MVSEVKTVGLIEDLRIYVESDPSTVPNPVTGKWTWEGKTYQVPVCPICGTFLERGGCVVAIRDIFCQPDYGTYRLISRLELANNGPTCYHCWKIASPLWYHERWMFPGIEVDND